MNWTLLNPWMLLFGTAALVPLVLYLLRRRSPVRIEWAAMQFLEEASRSPVTKRNWRQWLLLGIRISLPLLIALVASTPGCIDQQQPTARNLVSPVTHWVFALDTSASMGQRANGAWPLESAIADAVRLVRDASPGDLYSIIVLNRDQPLNLDRVTASKSTAERGLESLVSASGTFQLESAWQQVADAIQATQQAGMASQARVVLLSDFAGPVWRTDFKIPSILSNDSVSFQLVPCGQVDTNLAIRELRVLPASVTLDQGAQCSVDIEGFGLTEPATTTLTLHVNQRQIAQRTIEVQPNSRNTTTIPIDPFSMPGSCEIVASLTKSGLLIDDQRFQTIQVRPSINALCVEGFPAAARNYVAATTAIPESSLPAIRCLTISQSELSQVDLQAIQVIALFGCNSFTNSEIERLQAAVMSGKGLLLSPGPQADRASWQRLLDAIPANSNNQSSAGTIRVGQPAPRADYRLDPLEYQHPIVRDFKDQPQAGIIDAPISGYFQVQIDLPEQFHPVLNIDNGDSAIVGWNSQKGSALLFTTPIHPLPRDGGSEPTTPWNRLPAWWSYVPLVNNSTTWLFAAATDNPAVSSGQTNEISLPTLARPGNFEFQFPDSASPPTSVVKQNEEGTTVAVLGPSQPGFIRIEVPGLQTEEPSFSQSVAVNSPVIEQDLQRTDLTRLEARLSGTESTVVTENTRTNKQQRSQRFYIVALWAMLGLLLLEPLLANRQSALPTRQS